jgi:hypothetical protein
VCVDTRARTHAHTHVHVHSHCTVRTRTHSYRHGRRLTLTIYEAVLNPYARYSRLWLSTGACTRACTPSHSAPNASPGLLTSHSARFIPRYCSAMHRPQLQHYQHTSDSLFPSKLTFNALACPDVVHGAPPSTPIIHALSTCAVPLASFDWATRLSMYESQDIFYHYQSSEQRTSESPGLQKGG